ncbi:hypothetical protein [Natronosalvus rutilus]|uniref:Uncharacterized protein n=1 Tax=Natronosalvus rutilus TaxID=2953753 RepID=A0A9E7NCD6_9EURY|nr:hypothetical protein [Natronosalvus rutilus]UTF54365.1 hypothetical protein NGM29_03535 [Natronosalvus rutilus]
MERDLTRRQLLAGLAGGGAVLGGGRAVDNVLLGYDRFTGTNLVRQDLDPLVSAELRPSGTDVATVDGYRIEHRDGRFSLVGGDGRDDASDGDDSSGDGSDDEADEGRGDDVLATVSSTDDPTAAADVDREYDLEDGPLEQLVADIGALESGDVRFVYDSYPAFFEFVREHESRPYTVAALRGYRTADPDRIEAFSGADPADPEAVAEGLVDGFREYSSYDIPRYVAGSVEDNVILGAYDLRQHFESDTDYEAIVAGENTGLFCYELTRRSVDALQAVHPLEQTVPVVGGYVKDTRHKHVYTILTSVVDVDGETVIPVTFLDYTHSTAYDDLRVRWVMGEGLDAYDRRHRATSIDWYQFA